MKSKINQLLFKGSVYCGMAAVLMALTALASCVDDDYQNIVKQGDPQIQASQPATAQMGDSVTLNVACSDAKGTALSTLKAELMFSGEVVDQTTIRTRQAGDYQVRLGVPFLQYVPNGDATVRLTLQNVTTSTTVADVQLPVERPHFSDLQFITTDSTVYNMVEQEDYTYTATIQTAQNGFKGRFLTKDGRWAFGNSGAEVALGQTGNLDFQTATPGEVTVTFNTRDFTYSPVEDIPIVPLQFTEGDNLMTRDLVQGNQYTIGGMVDDEYFIDPDFFELNDDGTYTFLALSGTYTLTAYKDYQFLQVYPGTSDAPATLQADGTGGVWVIGGNGINKPYLTTSNNNGWWTGTEWDQPLAPIAEKQYRITLTVGRQLSATDVNFKFFGQPNWGTEFHGDGGDYSLSCESDVFGVGDGNGHDNGNVYLKDGAVLNDGDVYIFTVDLTAGVANGRLIVTKGTSAGVNSVALQNGQPVVSTMKKGAQYAFTGDVSDDFFIDPDFFRANGDGTYTFLAISGQYALKSYVDYKYLQVYPVDAEGQPATMQGDGTGSIWIIGSECVNKPYLTSDNNHGWWTDPDWDICMAPVSDKVYQVTLTVGQQLSASDINFKFFGQPTWGVEFNGQGGDYHLDTDNEWFRVNAADSDNGNIFLRDGVTLNDGDTFLFTIDLTSGPANGVLKVEKK